MEQKEQVAKKETAADQCAEEARFRKYYNRLTLSRDRHKRGKRRGKRFGPKT